MVGVCVFFFFSPTAPFVCLLVHQLDMALTRLLGKTRQGWASQLRVISLKFLRRKLITKALISRNAIVPCCLNVPLMQAGILRAFSLKWRLERLSLSSVVHICLFHAFTVSVILLSDMLFIKVASARNSID